MTFHDATFPLDISRGAEGGPTRRTEIVSLVSGHETRNTPWADSRRRYNVGYGVKSLADLETVTAFFEARRGRLYAFRFRDPFDHKSCAIDKTPQADDQTLGIGDGAATMFDLVKRYASGGASYDRRVAKPVSGSVLVALAGAPQTLGVDYTLDDGTGRLTFAAPPAQGVSVTAGFLFDTPVRFDADSLQINLAAFDAGEIPSIPLVEVRV
ncbi:MAG: DUF2460 domain-containing protein [Pseudomonadota bacterium]